jgi:hypothetical protein
MTLKKLLLWTLVAFVLYLSLVTLAALFSPFGLAGLINTFYVPTLQEVFQVLVLFCIWGCVLLYFCTFIFAQ